MKRKAREDRRMENVVFKAALEPLEAAGLRRSRSTSAKPRSPRAPRGTLHQAKDVWRRLDGSENQRQKIWVR